jgi:uncharacterized protein (DUF58 family)
MLSPEIIARIKALDLRGRHAATELMTGDYASAFHGRGMEFHEVREYVPGDDIRGIDWNVTARMSQPFVKVFREERELTLMLMVDVSASLASGSGRSRRDAAAELAAVLAWLAIKSNDRVGLMLFGQDVELFVPPRKGQGHVWRIIRDVLTWPGQSKGTNLSAALDHLSQTVKRRAVCFVISDFLSSSFESALARMSRQHDVTCVQMTYDPVDGISQGDGAGILMLVDRETGEHLEFDESDWRVKNELKEFHHKRQSELKDLLRKSGAEFFSVVSHQNVVDPLSVYLKGHRERRRFQR